MSGAGGSGPRRPLDESVAAFRWQCLGGTPQVLDYVLTRASYTEQELSTYAIALTNTGVFTKEDLDVMGWIVPFLKKRASRGLEQQMCLRQNATDVRHSNWRCLCTNYVHACVLCSQKGHGAFFFNRDQSWACDFHGQYDEQQRSLCEKWGIQEKEMDAALGELVAWRRAHPNAPIPSQQSADAAVLAAAAAVSRPAAAAQPAAQPTPAQPAPPAQPPTTVARPSRATVVAVQVVKDFVDETRIDTARVQTVDELRELLEDVPHQLPQDTKLYASRPSVSQTPAELTDQDLWRLNGLNPPGLVFACFVTEGGASAAAAEAASLFCHVPAFEQDPLWNPTGDLYSIRPIDLLRRLYDELSLALRWFVADHLQGTDIWFEPGGIKKQSPTRLCFSAHDMQRSDKGQVTKELHVVALTNEAYNHARTSLRNANVKARDVPKGGAAASATPVKTNLWPSDEAKCVHRNLDGFFSLRCAWDCDKLLQHIKRNKQQYAPAGLALVASPCTAAAQLFMLRNMVFHRSFLAQGTDKEILDYTIRAVRLFFLLTDRLFKLEESTQLERFEAPFRAHRNQLVSMRKLAEHMFERLGHPVVDESHVQGYLQSMLLDPHFNSSENFPLQLQLVLSFGTRFHKPLSVGGDAALLLAGAVPSSAAAPGSFTSGAVGALASVPSGKVVTLLSRSKVQRWEWNPASQSAVQGGYPLSDPLGVNLADVLWRGLDAMGVILHSVLFEELWKQPEFRPPALARVKQLHKYVLNDESGFKLEVLIPDRQVRGDEEEVDLETEEVRYYRDPSLLLQSLRNVVEQMQQTDALRALLDDIIKVHATRDQLAHQYYMEKPADISVATTRVSMKSIMRVVQGAIRLINTGWHKPAGFRLLLTLQEAVCSDDVSSPRGNYKKYRDRQQVGIKERAFELKHTEGVRRVLKALLISRDPNHLRVARALLDRFSWRPRADRSSVQSTAASAAAGFGPAPIPVANLFELLIEAEQNAEESDSSATSSAAVAPAAAATPTPKGRYNKKKK